ncbi:hypothetical protein OIE66_24100 [Nonomuraea sp. NBC_01738]|uniref:hypothetical protein n=1 Tax=Nonomuraea sp. NBC_01738 TaxID=2976003 RepID=UPI002E15248D|nr:hypothetical protein OIE66_24100 [Nonomuraea sp. NBC_01738]
MAHHHKSNEAVEGNPETKHRGGLPLRPDEDELDERTEEERVAAGLAADPDAGDVDRSDAAVRNAVEKERSAERDSGDFPPTRYEDS